MEAQQLSQIYNAIIAGIVLVVGAFAVFLTAWFRYVPKRMDARLKEYQANEATKREIAKEKSDTIRENEKVENRVKLAQATMLEKQSEFYGKFLEEFRESRNTSEALTIATANTTQAVNVNGRQIAELVTEFGKLRDKVEETGEKVTQAFDKLPSNTTQLESSIASLSDIANNITGVQIDLNLLMTKIGDVQARLITKKSDSQPISIPPA